MSQIDYKSSEIGKQNWEVCTRMLMHDLLDMRHIKQVKELLDFYCIEYTDNGGYTMALPRKNILKLNGKFDVKPIEKILKSRTLGRADKEKQKNGK